MSLYQTMACLTTMSIDRLTFENIAGKEENAGKQYLSFSYNVLHLSWGQTQSSVLYLNASIMKFLIWTSLKFLLLKERVKIQLLRYKSIHLSGDKHKM